MASVGSPCLGLPAAGLTGSVTVDDDGTSVLVSTLREQRHQVDNRDDRQHGPRTGRIADRAVAGAVLRVHSRMDRLDDRVDRIENRLRAVEIGLAEVKTLVSGGGRSRLGGGGPTVTPLPRGN